MSILPVDRNVQSLNHVACPQCNSRVDDSAPACPNCGYKIYVEHPGDTTPVRHPKGSGLIESDGENEKSTDSMLN